MSIHRTLPAKLVPLRPKSVREQREGRHLDRETGIHFGHICSALLDVDRWYRVSVRDCAPPRCLGCEEMLATSEEAAAAIGQVFDPQWFRRDLNWHCLQCKASFAAGDKISEQYLGRTLDSSRYAADSTAQGYDDFICVSRSPYFTLSADTYGACGNSLTGMCLDRPHAVGVPTYCLGPEWFVGLPPYAIFQVKDGKLILPEGDQLVPVDGLDGWTAVSFLNPRVEYTAPLASRELASREIDRLLTEGRPLPRKKG